MLIDTHCHITHMTTDTQRISEIIQEASDQTVTTIINVSTNVIDSNASVQLAQEYSSVYATIGIHPNDVSENWRSDIAHLKNLLDHDAHNKIVGIGECGLDYHYPPYNKERQYDAFKAQIELALAYDRALVIHTRDAQDETLHILDEYKNNGLRGTIHCFSEDTPFAYHALQLGFVLGIGGTITYPKNNSLRETVKTIGFEHIILETDAPFLPPQIIRGKQNHPLFIKTIAEYVAALLPAPYAMVAQKTTDNARRIFRLP